MHRPRENVEFCPDLLAKSGKGNLVKSTVAKVLCNTSAAEITNEKMNW